MKIIFLSALILCGCASVPNNNLPSQTTDIQTGGYTDAPFGCTDGKTRRVQC